MKKYFYTPKDHAKLILNKYQGISNCKIPQKILIDLKENKYFTESEIKEYLRNNNLKIYYREIPLIYKILNGKNLHPEINKKDKEEFLRKLEEILSSHKRNNKDMPNLRRLLDDFFINKRISYEDENINFLKLLNKPSECSICLEMIIYEEHNTFLPCFHSFHNECINRWFLISKTCPECRIEIP